jgi:hypothetical protein
MATSHLASLPTEILVIVASSLTTVEYGKLRLTCKTIEQKLFPFFATEFFSIRQFMLFELSLQCLVNISKHPRLSSFVKKLILGYDSVPPFSPRNNGRVDEKLPNRINYNFSNSWLISSGEAKDLLTSALRNFNCRCIEFKDYKSNHGRTRDSTTWRSYGVKTMGESIGLGAISEIPLHDGSQPHPLSLVLRALAQSQSHIEALEDITRYPGSAAPANAFYVPDYLHEEYAAAFANVKTLKLYLKYAHPIQSPQISHWKSFQSFLALLPNLEHLRLNLTAPSVIIHCCSNFIIDILTRVESGLKGTQIRRLELGKFPAPGEFLLSFILKFRHTLEHLKLHIVSLPSIPAYIQTDKWFRYIWTSTDEMDGLLSLARSKG